MNSRTYESWIEAKAKLDLWKKKEKELRLRICDNILEGKTAGTHKVVKGRYLLKGIKKITTSIDQEVLPTIWEDLTKDEQDCVKFTPSLIAKEYKGCENHSTLDQAITTKPAMPGLSIEVAPE